jgi:hypothetical protein
MTISQALPRESPALKIYVIKSVDYLQLLKEGDDKV